MAKQYRQRDSGLLVPGNDSIELPKPTAPVPWYARGMLWPAARFMGRRKCCCGVTVPCAPCVGGVAPQSLEVTLPSFTNQSCADCGDLEGAYIVEHLSSNPTVCTWQYLFGGDPCNMRDILLHFNSSGVLSVFLQNNDPNYPQPGNYWFWFWTLGGFSIPFDCYSFDHSLPIGRNDSSAYPCTHNDNPVHVRSL